MKISYRCVWTCLTTFAFVSACTSPFSETQQSVAAEEGDFVIPGGNTTAFEGAGLSYQGTRVNAFVLPTHPSSTSEQLPICWCDGASVVCTRINSQHDELKEHANEGKAFDLSASILRLPLNTGIRCAEPEKQVTYNSQWQGVFDHYQTSPCRTRTPTPTWEVQALPAQSDLIIRDTVTQQALALPIVSMDSLVFTQGADTVTLVYPSGQVSANDLRGFWSQASRAPTHVGAFDASSILCSDEGQGSYPGGGSAEGEHLIIFGTLGLLGTYVVVGTATTLSHENDCWQKRDAADLVQPGQSANEDKLEDYLTSCEASRQECKTIEGWLTKSSDFSEAFKTLYSQKCSAR